MSSNSTLPSSGTSLQSERHPFVQFAGLVNGAWFVFAVVSVASSKLGGLVRHVGLPLITGYLLVGVLCGPFVLDIVQKHHIPDLTYVTQAALAFIAFSAGSELYLPELRSLFKPIALVSVGTSLACFVLCSLLIFAVSASPLASWANDFGGTCRLTISLLAGSIMVARSPASAIAVVRELQARGTLTSCMLGVTVVSDVIVLLIFALSSSMALAQCSTAGFNGAEFLLTVLTLVVAIGAGVACGWAFTLLLRAPNRWAQWLILPCGLLIFLCSDWLHVWTAVHLGFALNFDALLICITAAYVVTNRSANRVAFLRMLSQASTPILVSMFTKVGVELDLNVLWRSIAFAIIVFLLRAIAMAVGGWFGGRIGGLSVEHSKLVWLTMLSQAGVSLGLASEVSVKFADSFGPAFQTAVVGVVLLSQIVGPVLCKYAIKRAREAANTGDGADGGLVPELHLTYEDEDEAGDVTPQAAAGGGASGVAARRHTRARSSLFSPTGSGWVTNVHGSRWRKPTRFRALFVGIDSTTLAVASRLLRSEDGSVVLLDESAEQCAKAEAMLLQPLARRALEQSDPLPSLLRRVSALASRIPAGIESVVDTLLPPEDASDSATLIDQHAAAASQPKTKPKTKSQGKHRGSTHVSTKRGGFAELKDEPDDDDNGVSEDDDEENDDGELEDVTLEDSAPSASPATSPQAPSGSASLRAVRIDPTARASATSPSATRAAPASAATAAVSSAGALSPLSPSGLSSRVHVSRLALESQRSMVDAYRALEDELFLHSSVTDSVLVRLNSDAEAYELARHLSDRRRMQRVLVRVHHPAWVRPMADVGVLPLHARAMENQLLSAIMRGAGAEDATASGAGSGAGAGGSNQKSDGGSSASWSLASLFSFSAVGSSLSAEEVSLLPPSELLAGATLEGEDLDCALSELDASSRAEFLRAHPPPPEQLLSASHSTRPRFNLVPESQRDGYVTALAALHGGALERDEVASAERDANRQSFAFIGVMESMRSPNERIEHTERQARGGSAATNSSLPHPRFSSSSSASSLPHPASHTAASSSSSLPAPIVYPSAAASHGATPAAAASPNAEDDEDALLDL